MTTKFVVTDERNRTFQKRRILLEKRWLDGKLDPEIVLPGLQMLMEGRGIVSNENSSIDWLSIILARERQYHSAFFGQEFDLAEFEKKLRFHGRKKVKFWQSLGLQPHFFPAVSLMPGNEYPGWKIKPEDSFYQSLGEGKIFRDISGQLVKVAEARLEGISVLIDIRLKPAYDNGRQMYEKDNLLGLIIEQLRKEEKIAQYDRGPQSSRFGVSADDWEEKIKPALDGKLGLGTNRLETVEEGNIISQIYLDLPRAVDGSTNTWVWYEQYFEGRGLRFHGGDSDRGGLASVNFHSSGYYWSLRSFRSLAVL